MCGKYHQTHVTINNDSSSSSGSSSSGMKRLLQPSIGNSDVVVIKKKKTSVDDAIATKNNSVSTIASGIGDSVVPLFPEMAVGEYEFDNDFTVELIATLKSSSFSFLLSTLN